MASRSTRTSRILLGPKARRGSHRSLGPLPGVPLRAVRHPLLHRLTSVGAMGQLLMSDRAPECTLRALEQTRKVLVNFDHRTFHLFVQWTLIESNFLSHQLSFEVFINFIFNPVINLSSKSCFIASKNSATFILLYFVFYCFRRANSASNCKTVVLEGTLIELLQNTFSSYGVTNGFKLI